MHRQSGFTIIELLIVIGLISLLVAFAVPSMLDFNRRSVLTAEATEFTDTLSEAQNYAESNVQSVPGEKTDRYQVTLLQESGGSAGCYRGYSISAINEGVPAVATQLSEGDLTCGVSIVSSFESLEFDAPRGTAIGVTTPKTLTLCSEQGHITVTVDSTGRISKSDFIEDITPCTCSVSCNTLVTPVPTP